jgi:hypothetical protein
MPSCHSFQLPDLLAIIGSLELRTNPHCRFVTDASEKWLSGEPDMLTANELSYLHLTKIGLLASLCFPACDAPQLRILTDFLTAVIFSGMRESTPGHSSVSDLKKDEPPEQDTRQSATDILRNDELFKQLRTFRSSNAVLTTERVSKHPQRPLHPPDIKGIAIMESSFYIFCSDIPDISGTVHIEPVKA